MRFLIDESCDFAVVRALREAGHDVASVSEMAPGLPDHTVIDLARQDERLVITEDKDFGRLVHASDPGAGVILLRFHARSRSTLVATIVQAINEQRANLQSAFSVVRPGNVRIVRRVKE